MDAVLMANGRVILAAAMSLLPVDRNVLALPTERTPDFDEAAQKFIASIIAQASAEQRERDARILEGRMKYAGMDAVQSLREAAAAIRSQK